MQSSIFSASNRLYSGTVSSVDHDDLKRCPWQPFESELLSLRMKSLRMDPPPRVILIIYRYSGASKVLTYRLYIVTDSIHESGITAEDTSVIRSLLSIGSVFARCLYEPCTHTYGDIQILGVKEQDIESVTLFLSH